MQKNKELISTIVEAIQEKKGSDITLLNLEKLDTAPASTFVICQGRSTSQVSAIADEIRDEVRIELGIKPYSYDGYRNSQWIVIDYGDVFIHVFLPEVREFYNLEGLWGDAEITEIPNLD